MDSIADPDAGECDGKQKYRRDPECAREEDPGERERCDAQPDVQDDHLGDRRALGRRVRDSAGNVRDVRWTAHAEEGSDDTTENAGRRGPTPTESSRRGAPKRHVERVPA